MKTCETNSSIDTFCRMDMLFKLNTVTASFGIISSDNWPKPWMKQARKINTSYQPNICCYYTITNVKPIFELPLCFNLSTDIWLITCVNFCLRGDELPNYLTEIEKKAKPNEIITTFAPICLKTNKAACIIVICSPGSDKCCIYIHYRNPV